MNFFFKHANLNKSLQNFKQQKIYKRVIKNHCLQVHLKNSLKEMVAFKFKFHHMGIVQILKIIKIPIGKIQELISLLLILVISRDALKHLINLMI